MGEKKKKETNLKKTFDSIGNILFVRRIRVRVMVTKDSGRKKKKKNNHWSIAVILTRRAIVMLITSRVSCIETHRCPRTFNVWELVR